MPQAQAAAAAQRHGLAFRYHPVSGAKVTEHDTVETFVRLMDELPGPVLFYCGTGTRCTILWSQAAAPRLGADAALAAARRGGHELEFLRDTLIARGEWAGAIPVAGIRAGARNARPLTGVKTAQTYRSAWQR